MPSLLWLVVSHMPDPGQLTAKKQRSYARSTVMWQTSREAWITQICDLWYSVMSQSHRIEGGTADEAFQEQCFLWERGDFFVAWQYGHLFPEI